LDELVVWPMLGSHGAVTRACAQAMRRIGMAIPEDGRTSCIVRYCTILYFVMHCK